MLHKLRLHVRQVGKRNRVVGETLMNRDSSRSHAIFTITVERADQAPPGAVSCTGPGVFSVCALQLPAC